MQSQPEIQPQGLTATPAIRDTIDRHAADPEPLWPQHAGLRCHADLTFAIDDAFKHARRQLHINSIGKWHPEQVRREAVMSARRFGAQCPVRERAVLRRRRESR